MNPPDALDPATEEALIAHLLQFVTPEKQARMERVMAGRTSFLQVVLEGVYQPHNASAVIRSCDCFGIQHLHVIETRCPFTLNREVAMGAMRWVQVHRYRAPGRDNTARCLAHLRDQGLRIVATSTDPGALSLEELPLDRKTALWFGNEQDGLSAAALAAADCHLHIPMLGFTPSLNISVCAAICLQHLRARLANGPCDWRLQEPERRAAYRLWLRGTVKKCAVLERAFLPRGSDPARFTQDR